MFLANSKTNTLTINLCRRCNPALFTGSYFFWPSTKICKSDYKIVVKAK